MAAAETIYCRAGTHKLDNRSIVQNTNQLRLWTAAEVEADAVAAVTGG